MVELQGLQLRLADFEKRNTEVVAVVVDPVERNRDVVEQLGLGYRIAADPKLETIDAYGLRHGTPGEPSMARPATFVIDANGVVRWRSLTDNFRLRPKPDEILAAIDSSP